MQPEPTGTEKFFDPVTERTVLGDILLDNLLLCEARELLSPSHFFFFPHQKIYQAMLDVGDCGRPIDVLGLTEILERRGELKDAGGLEYVAALTDGVVHRTTLRNLAARLIQKAQMRELYGGLERLQSDMCAPGTSVEAASQRLAELLPLASQAGEHGAGHIDLAPNYSEEALALRFSAAHGSVLRYTPAWNQWLEWTGQRWLPDQTLRVFDLVRSLCRASSMSCADPRIAARIACAQTVAAVERLIRCDRRHVSTVERWDSDLWLLNTPAGTVNLRTGQTGPHERGEFLTKMTAVGPAGDCPAWLEFLRRITDRNVHLENFLQRVAGYCLTGLTIEHALFFLFGTGANGKSVFMTTLSAILGDYAKTAPLDMFMTSTNDRHPTDLASLYGARIVTAAETEFGRSWAESRLKALTGGDKITARHMRQDFFEYTPEFKLLIAGNHRPRIRNLDEALRRRIHLIPFSVTIPGSERDHHLVEKLKSEWPGILQWAIHGCLAWQEQTLAPPEIVRVATSEYLAGEDLVGRWLGEKTIQVGGKFSSTTELYQDWKEWAAINGEHAGTLREFSERLERNEGVEKRRTKSARGFMGIVLNRKPVR